MTKILFIRDTLGALPKVTLQNFTASTAFSNVSTDTRTITKGCLFIALQGERFDGHNFLNEAVKKGASAIAVNENVWRRGGVPKNLPVIIAEDTTALLGQLAHARRKMMKATVISLTGSNGKTGTKDMLVAILNEKFKVHGTEANNNNSIGVPLTILQAPADTEVLVLEHGTNHFGEIEYSAAIAVPDIALITNIGASHLEFLKNQRNVLKEKKSLFDVADEAGGTVFINQDDKYLRSIGNHYARRTTFGTKSTADVTCKVRRFTNSGLPSLRIEGFGTTVEATLPLYGKQNAWNANAAAAIALSLGLTGTQIARALKKLTPPKHRLTQIPMRHGILIDDTYNANPQSMAAAFEVARNITLYANRWVILGDMFELGKDSEKLHKSLAPAIMKIPKIRVVTHGTLMHTLYRELKKYYVPVWHCETREQLTQFINDTDFSGAVTLVKGSRGMKMEEFVKLIAERNA